jgi:AcrR family transcriptional regulator
VHSILGFSYTLTMSDDLSPRQRAAETKRRRTRIALLDAATVVFSKQGWQARMEDVAQQAGIGAATAYNHFPSKVGLMMHTFDHLMQPYQERATEAIETEIDPVFAVTRHVTEMTHNLSKSNAKLVRAYLIAMAESASNAVGPLIMEENEMVSNAMPESPLIELIAYGQKKKVFRADVMALAVGTYHTYAALWSVATDPIRPMNSSTANFVLDQLFSVIKVKP